MEKIRGWKRKGYLWVTLVLFVMSLTLHWLFAWKSYVQEQKEHNQPVEFTDYLNETLRDTMENWQSEFLQLMWQVAGLSFLFYVGSPTSKEGDDRKEEKMDYIIRQIAGGDEGEKFLKDMDRKYPKK
jgi:hypothetical protein